MKVGDRVRVVQSGSACPPIGTVGTIACIDHDDVPYGVEFEDFRGGGSLFGKVKCGTGSWFARDDIELCVELAHHYLVNGDDTIYTLYSMAEEAARSLATDCGDPVAIAKVIAYAKPTISIIVEKV